MENRSIQFVTCTYESHAGEILDIFNEAILNSTALYEYQPRTMENMRDWFGDKLLGSFPVLGAIDPQGKLLGFATYGAFRAKPAYKYSVEHSIYVHRDYRCQGLGRSLMQQLITAARQQQYHVMIAAIDINSRGSLALHESLGFVYGGTLKQVGFKFGQWLDLALYQYVLDTPDRPVDG
ncbi:MAG: N-acetyltransferase [Alkalinema sp. RU_4_3]|nr:N-acetyltransferase [Alkalinema sp. RU_4_3]